MEEEEKEEEEEEEEDEGGENPWGLSIQSHDQCGTCRDNEMERKKKEKGNKKRMSWREREGGKTNLTAESLYG